MTTKFIGLTGDEIRLIYRGLHLLKMQELEKTRGQKASAEALFIDTLQKEIGNLSEEGE